MRKTALRLSPLEACDQAICLLKQAGFEFVKVSMKSHTAYYRFPGRYGVLRVGTHPKSNGNSRAETGPVCGTITYSPAHAKADGKLLLSAIHVENTVANAVGRYMIKSTPIGGSS